VFATDLNDTAVQDMMKNHIVALDTLEMTEEDLDKSKVFKEAEKTAVTIEAERISKLTFDKRIPALLKAGIITSESTYKMGKRFGLL
jgi:hypothetical protein